MQTARVSHGRRRAYSIFAAVVGAAVFLTAAPLIDAHAITGISSPVRVSASGFGQFTETASAADPTNAQNLFAGSNEGSCNTTLSRLPSFKSANGGTSWTPGNSAPVRNAGDGSLDPTAAFDSTGSLLYAYLEIGCDYVNHVPNNSTDQLVISRSADKGATWSSSPTVIEGIGQVPDKPALAIDTTSTSPFKNNQYVAYVRTISLIPQPLLVAHCSAAGCPSPWPTVQVDGGSDSDGSLAIDASGNVYVSWWDFIAQRIRISVSRDGGQSYSRLTDAASTVLSFPGCRPPNYRGNVMFAGSTLAVDRSNGNLYIVWDDGLPCPSSGPGLTGSTGGTLPGNGGYQVSHTYVTAQGESSPSPDSTVTLTPSQNAIQTSSLSGLNANITGVRYYLDGVPAGSGISTGFVGSSAVSGGTAPGILITSGGSSAAPSPRMHIYFSRSTDGGTTWSSAKRIDTGNPNDAWQPSLTVDQSNHRVVIAWYDRRNDPVNVNKFYRAYYAQSGDSGLTFQDAPLTTTLSDPTSDPAQEGTGDYLAITAGGGSAHPVWVESHAVGTTQETQVYTASVSDAQALYNWVKLTPTSSPSTRAGANMAFDVATNTAVLFGGRHGTAGSTSLGDTWTWNGTVWSQQHPVTSPPARWLGGMAYYATTNTVILFGGLDANGVLLGDTWSWDGSTWTQLHPAHNPSPRVTPSLTSYPPSGGLVLFGGQDNMDRADTWTWNGSDWTQTNPMQSPPARAGAGLSYDPGSGVVVLFGGQQNLPAGDANDTWTWDGSNWTQMTPTTSPGAREELGMDFDAAAGTVVLFGGETEGNPYVWNNDTWAWTGSDWIKQAPATSPSARDAFAFVYDPAMRSMLLFGGRTATNGRLGDTWSY
jgi:hypothetical protein